MFAVFLVAAGAAENGAMRPWRGTWSGELTIIGNCEGSALLIVENGIGYMEHMGRTGWYNKYCLDPVTWTATSENAVETAANGDEIHVRTSLQVIWTSATSGNWIETETVISGTGRFSAAKGVSHTGGTFSFTTPTKAVWEGTTTGMLSY
jgi:hypothetical protein